MISIKVSKKLTNPSNSNKEILLVQTMDLERKLCHSVLLVGTEKKEPKVPYNFQKKEPTEDGYLITTHDYNFYQFVDSDSFEKGFQDIAKRIKQFRIKKTILKIK